MMGTTTTTTATATTSAVKTTKESAPPVTFQSITYGELTQDEMFHTISGLLEKHPKKEYVLSIGTDSQTRSEMKMVAVVLLHEVGKGAKFFHSITRHPRSSSLREKIYTETQKSLTLAKNLTAFLYEKNLDFEITIHVDMGENKEGRTHTFVKEIMGWIKAEGFEAEYKPNAIAASCVADKISK